MSDEIIELLKNKKLRAKVVKTIKDIYSYAGTLHDNPTEDIEEDIDKLGTSLWEEAWWRAETCCDAWRIEEAFRKHVFDKMQKPYRISPEEIIEQFYGMASPGGIGCPELEYIDFDNLYTIFISQLNLHILSNRCSEPFPICRIPDNRKEFVHGMMFGYKVALAKLKGEDLDLNDQEEGEDTLWCKNGVSVRLLGRGYFRTSYARKISYLYADVAGHMSNLACEQLQSEMQRLLISVIRSMSLLEPVDGEKNESGCTNELPLVNNETLLQSKKVLIHKCIDAYYIEPTKKDSFDRRIHNAVHLLVESDAQSNDGVGLALSVAAMEALLGEKGGDIAEKLAGNVAFLLETELSKRNNAIKFAKNLYNLRSRTLHGEKVEGENQTYMKARHLAAAVLAAIISRRDFLIRGGFNSETPQQLLEGLREMRFDPGQLIGIDESNVRELWGCT